jgi:hypothetical protein
MKTKRLKFHGHNSSPEARDELNLNVAVALNNEKPLPLSGELPVDRRAPFAAAPALAGPWSEFEDIAPPETSAYDSQFKMSLKVVGTKRTVVIFRGDVSKILAQSVTLSC